MIVSITFTSIKDNIYKHKERYLAFGLLFVSAVIVLAILTAGNSGKDVYGDDYPKGSDNNSTIIDNDDNNEDTDDKNTDETPDVDPDEDPGNPVIIDDPTYVEIDEDRIILSSKVYSKKIVEDDSTNILVMGEDKLNTLMDTIGIISISKKSKKVSIIMIPRDMYMDYTKNVTDFMKTINKYDTYGTFKVNYTYFLGYEMKHEGKFSKDSHGVSFLTEAIEVKFNLTIDDYVKVNLNGFKEIVDLFGGVKITVPYDMFYEDPNQDLKIELLKGEQLLLGADAEGFVRFRSGTDRNGIPFEIGDFARKDNQINFMKAFYSQHATLSNITKLPSVISALSNNIWSSLRIQDILFKYIGMAKNILSDDYIIEGITIDGKFEMRKGVSHVIIE